MNYYDLDYGELGRLLRMRDEALLSLDRDKIIDYYKETGAENFPEDERIFWAGVHMARLHILRFPQAVKEESRKWLGDNGFVADFGS